MSMKQFISGGLFLLLAGTHSFTQGILPPDSQQPCERITFQVEDVGGTTISGAVVRLDEAITLDATNDKGITRVSCNRLSEISNTLEVQAYGFETLRIKIRPHPENYTYKVVLTPVKMVPGRPDSCSVNVKELMAEVRKKSSDLQKKASDAFDAGNYKVAEELFTEAINLTPSSAAIMTNLGIVALRRFDFEKAEDWFEKAKMIMPHSADLNRNLGVLRWMQQKWDESYNCLTEAVSHGHKSETVYYLLGVLALQKERTRESLYYFEKVSPDRYPARDLFRSIAFLMDGKPKKADKSFKKYIERNPASTMAGI